MPRLPLLEGGRGFQNITAICRYPWQHEYGRLPLTTTYRMGASAIWGLFFEFLFFYFPFICVARVPNKYGKYIKREKEISYFTNTQIFFIRNFVQGLRSQRFLKSATLKKCDLLALKVS